MRYHHTQYAPLYLILIVAGAAILTGSWFTHSLIIQIVLLVSAGIMFVFAASFRRLTVSDQGEHLLVSFGPLPLFRRRIPYDEMESAERSRTTIGDGWGIHMSPSGGWTWNLWGFDCVDVLLDRRRKVRIGTDDPEPLERFLSERLDKSAHESTLRL